MKKICYITTLGMTIEAFFIPQLKYLEQHGYDVSVICSSDKPNLKEELGGSIHYKPVAIPRGISIIGMLKAVWDLKKVFKNNKYDLIQYSTPNAALCAAYAGKICGIKIRNYHLMGFRYLGANGILRKILKYIEIITCRLSSSIECVSASNMQIGLDEGIFTENKATVVWNGSSGGVDLGRFNSSYRPEYRKEVRKRHQIEESEYVFGFVGRITKDKGVNELLSAFYELKAKCKLLLVGNIEIESSLDRELLEKSKKDPDVIYTGFTKEIEKYFAAIDCLVLPSYREGFGNVIIEAAAMGTPAIVSDIPGPIDAIEEAKTAIKVTPGEVSELKVAMESFFNKDNGITEDNCIKFVEDSFDSKVLCEKILERKEDLLYSLK